MAVPRLGLAALVEQAQALAEYEEAVAELARALPADAATILDFFEVPSGDAFDVVPEKAIAYFQAKGLKQTFSYAEMLDQEHDKAFTVAKMMNVDMLAQVRASLDSALANGTPFKEWADTITPILQSGGWWGRKGVKDPLTGEEIVAQLGSPWRLETIFRTNMQSAYAAGAWQEIEAQAEIAPFLMYDAVDDFRTRPLHASWDRKVLPVKHQWWNSHYPPNGYNSVVPDQRVSGHALLGLKAFYAGEVVEVVGASGGRFTVTAQHPVLTRRGWVDAKALCEGDELVAYRAEVGRGASSADLDEDHAPPTIAQVFDAMGLRARASVPRAAFNLNGDAFFFEGDVEVVGADRVLVDRVQAAAHEFAAKIDLLNASQGERLRACLRSLVALALADVPVSGGDGRDRGEPSLSSDSVLQILGSHRVRLDPIRAKVTSDILSTLAQLRPDLAQAHSAFIEAENLLRDWTQQIGALSPAQPGAEELRGFRAGSLDTSIADDPIGGFEVNPDAARDVADRHAGSVQFDRVATLRVSYYSGHVYDLQTVSGTMMLYGGESLPQYVVSNCRCGVIQLSAEEVEALGLQVARQPPDDGTRKWVNPRTGDVHYVANGIDPGFEHNAGKSLKWHLQEVAAQKEALLSSDMKAAAQKADAQALAQAKKAAADGTAAAAAAQAEAAAAAGKAALARAQAKAAEAAKQWDAQQQIDAIAKGKETAGKGAQYKIKALAEAKKSAAWPEAKATEKLDQVLALAAQLKKKAEDSSKLSLYKKAIVEGKSPPPAAVKVFNALPDGDKAAFVKNIEDAKAKADAAKKAAEEAALKAAAAAEQAKTPQVVIGAAPDPGKLTQIGSQKGSNPGGLFQDTDTGAKWYVKWPSDAEMIRNEVLAAKLYELGGVDVPEVHIIQFQGRTAIASRFVEGLGKGSGAELAAAAGAADGFAFDAWLANWDVVGLNFDNLLLKGGKAYRIDVGGSLRYKATGTLKPGASFGATVGELDSMKNAGLNPQAAAVFGKIDPAKFEDGVKRLLAVDEAQIRAVVETYGPANAATRAKLVETLLARRADIAKRFGNLAPPSAEALKAAIAEAAEQVSYARGLVDEAILTAVKGIASRAAKGSALEAKDVERVAAAVQRLAELRTAAQAVMLGQSRDELLGYYEAWVADLQAAAAPGAGKPAKWGGTVFKAHAGAIEIDAKRVKVPPQRAPGDVTPPGEANKIIGDALGPSAASLQVPQRPGAKALTARMHGEHQRVIAAYTGHYYRELNLALRTASASAAQKKLEKLLNEALSLGPAYKGTVYRGLSLSGSDRAAFIAMHKAAQASGSALGHAQFNSTSRAAGSSFGGNLRLVIESKTGVHVKPLSLHPGEDEVLFRSDAKFRVLRVDEGSSLVTIYLEEV